MPFADDDDAGRRTAAAAAGTRMLRLGTLFLLYFVQGAPYGFQTSCLPLILRQAGFSFTGLGALKLLFLPWVAKPFFAPIVERTKSKSWWLSASMLGLGATCWLSGALAAPTDTIRVAAAMLTLNVLSAVQDIAVDSLAIQTLAASELGAGNTVQVVAYKGGSVLAGGLLLLVRDSLGWDGMFYCFGAVYFVAVAALSSLNLVRQATNAAPAAPLPKEKDGQSPLSGAGGSPPSGALRLLSVPGTGWTLAFVLFYKLCERAEQTHSIFLVDKGVPTSVMAVAGTVMRSASVAGSLYGGYLLSAMQLPVDYVLFRYSIARVIPICAQWIILLSWGHEPMSTDAAAQLSTPASALLGSAAATAFFVYGSFAAMTAALFTAGVITTATFTLMMRISQTAPSDLQGTHYASLATFEVLGKLLFASAAGALIDTVGMEAVVAVFVGLAALTGPFILIMPKTVFRHDRSS